MKKMTLIGAALLVLASSAVFAEEHADTALKHTQMAIEHGEAGHVPVFIQHADEALIHAKKAAEVAKGESKAHMDAAAISLQLAVEQAKINGAGHLKAASEAAEEAERHIKAGNK